MIFAYTNTNSYIHNSESSQLLRQALSKCKLVTKFAQNYSSETDISFQAQIATNKEIMDFVRQDKLEFELHTEGDDTAKQIDRLFKGLDEIYSSQVDLQVVFKLKVYCIGGVVDKLSEEFQKIVTAQYDAKKEKLSAKKLKQEVNQRLQGLLSRCAWQSLVKAVSMDGFIGGEKKKDFFRQWKHRVMKFYQICKLQKLLLFTNLSFSFITKKFPCIEKSILILNEVATNGATYPTFLYKHN